MYSIYFEQENKFFITPSTFLHQYWFLIEKGSSLLLYLIIERLWHIAIIKHQNNLIICKGKRVNLPVQEMCGKLKKGWSQANWVSSVISEHADNALYACVCTHMCVYICTCVCMWNIYFMYLLATLVWIKETPCSFSLATLFSVQCEIRSWDSRLGSSIFICRSISKFLTFLSHYYITDKVRLSHYSCGCLICLGISLGARVQQWTNVKLDDINYQLVLWGNGTGKNIFRREYNGYPNFTVTLTRK